MEPAAFTPSRDVATSSSSCARVRLPASLEPELRRRRFLFFVRAGSGSREPPTRVVELHLLHREKTEPRASFVSLTPRLTPRSEPWSQVLESRRRRASRGWNQPRRQPDREARVSHGEVSLICRSSPRQFASFHLGSRTFG
ncbi:hypothetical protein F2Q70_00016218 [Brassica cretica]|uniref:Uncharacterized protein n=1 Tax=Brassica cretica TaxID=69181 RepID=A0A8S9HWW8_BRACR|nr:hypothetical protein F2Q70_00016218 [Brassica cretica]KAF2597240.1 hypothetical protein F2Q68_00009200 [Brassica cretica]